MVEFGYHKTDDGSRFIFGAVIGNKIQTLHIPLFSTPMREYFKDFSADGLFEYFKPKILSWLEEKEVQNG